MMDNAIEDMHVYENKEIVENSDEWSHTILVLTFNLKDRKIILVLSISNGYIKSDNF